MKKLVLTLIVAFSFCGSILAQEYGQSHWPDFNHHNFQFQGGLVAAISINGHVYTVEDAGWDYLEAAAFVGDVCRGNNLILTDAYVIEYGDPYPTFDALPIYYDNGGEEVSFKLYDHSTGIEYDSCEITYLGEPMTILTGEEHYEAWLDEPYLPIILNFIGAGPDIIYWNDPEDWPVPDSTIYTPVVIPDNTQVIIPTGCTAVAGEITMGEGSSIVIEEGGFFDHSGSVNVTMNMTITPNLSKDGEVDNANYRLIASPIYQSIVAAETGLTENYNGMDLYSFDQSYPEEEWRNYKVADNNFTDLAIGKGYLYYNSATVVVTFFGQTVPTNVIYPIDLTYSDDAQIEEWKGLNLVGNPFTCKATPGRDFYVLNATGDEVELATEEFVAPMKGFFVLAENGEDQCMMTKYVPSGEKSSLNMSVSQGRNIVDMARLRFGADQSLLKIQLNPNHTKVYMPVEGKNYAVASAPEMGEMPVSFKAESNGTYSLSFTNENVTFSYLHLIDNLTGIETDLLATPSYTFDAKTTDYASRFRLVFVTGSNNEEDFAFFSNGNFVINNEGNATLQVIDINGRVIKSESINGCASVNVNAASGVYMLRLINGDNVKVQKVVVK